MVSHERIIYKLVSSPMFRNTPLVPQKVEPHQTRKGKDTYLLFSLAVATTPSPTLSTHPHPPIPPAKKHTNTKTHTDKQKNINYHWIGKVKACD